MARKPRFKIAGVAQLITQRGNNNQAVFFSEQDYQHYLGIFNQAAIQEECQIHAFVLMTNYIHILATPTTLDGISQMMKNIGQRYVSYINKLEKRSGTLWDGRYKASLVENGQYLINCMYFIDSVPIRSSIVKISKDYPWSSYQFNTQGEDVKVKITAHSNYSPLVQLSKNNNKDVQEEYKLMFREGLPEKEMQKIDKAINSNTIYGSKDFKNDINSGVRPY